jgi:hypothetical protein
MACWRPNGRISPAWPFPAMAQLDLGGADLVVEYANEKDEQR